MSLLGTSAEYTLMMLPVSANERGLEPVCYRCLEEVHISIGIVYMPRKNETRLELTGECCGRRLGDHEALDASGWNAEVRRNEVERAFWLMIQRNGIVSLPETGAELERAFLKTAIGGRR